MNVTIIGGGNMGMCLLGEISRVRGYHVTICASKPEEFSKRILVIDDERHITYESGDFSVTDDLKESVADADIILCTYPAFLRKHMIEEISNVVKYNCYLGFVPGYGGAEFYCNDLIEKGVTIFGLQKVPYVARTKVRGQVAGLMSKKSVLYIGTIPMNNTEKVAEIIQDMLLIECKCLSNYMAATLLPGNPLLHTSGSYVYLKNYKEGDFFPEQIYYYQTWTDEMSQVICNFSDEMMDICKKLPIDLSQVSSIQDYYESPTPAKLTEKFHNIPSFQPLTLPMIQEEKGFKPDFSSRFYTEDIPFGVCIIKALGMMVDANTPTIDTILDWYYRMTGKKYFEVDGTFGKDINETAIPQLYGLLTTEDLKSFYLR